MAFILRFATANVAEELSQKYANKIMLFVTDGLFSSGFNVVFDGIVDSIISIKPVSQLCFAML